MVSPMFSAQFITLVFLTDRGTKETIHLDHSSMFEARRLAGQVLRAGGGLYTRVEIDTGDVLETIDEPELSDVSATE